MMYASITRIEYHLPACALTNGDLAEQYPQWTAQKIEDKTGIRERHIAAESETAVDLAVSAARLVLDGEISPGDIDYLILCTQTPDYFLPTSACILQNRLGLRTSVGAIDVNLGCSGYVYGLSLAKGLIETDQAKNILLLTADTYSKLLDPADHTVRTLFGDAAAATLIQGVSTGAAPMHSFVFGTDGSGATNLIVRGGGLRARSSGDKASEPRLEMNGPEIFAFTLRAVPDLVMATVEKASFQLDDIDVFAFHQANAFMLDHLRAKLGIPSEKFLVSLADCGNTVSSSIPIALKSATRQGKLRHGQRVMLVGFGVGYSWGAAIVHWTH